ncbi:MAG: tetratricopeptide repeat protein [Leptospiraceae bacterium]|nr:tetratricopeptide repeat protein [Leptospiraceae bacterium]
MSESVLTVNSEKPMTLKFSPSKDKDWLKLLQTSLSSLSAQKILLLFLLIVSCGFSVRQAIWGQFFSSEQNFRAAGAAFKDGNYYAARLIFQEIVAKDPTGEYGDDSQYYNSLTYYYEADYKSAIFEFKILRRDWPSSEFIPRADYFTGEAYFYQGNYKQSLETHKVFVRTFPQNSLAPNALYTIGYIYMQEKRYDEAIAEFQRSLISYPDAKINGTISLQLGIAYYNLKEFAAARREFQKAVVNYGAAGIEDKAQLWIGKAWYAEGNITEAERAFNLILERFPDSESAPEAMYFIALCRYSQKDIAGSRAKLDELTKRYPDWKQIDSVYFRQAQTSVELKNDNDALVYLNALVERFPESEFYLPALELIGDIQYRKGNITAALDLYSNISEKENIKPAIKYALRRKTGDLLFLSGDFTAAASQYEILTAMDSTENSQPEAMFMAAQAWFKAGMSDKAFAQLEDLVKKYPRSTWRADAYYLQGEIHFSLTAYDSALQSYRRVLRFFKDHARFDEAWLGVGWSYFELSQYARAADEFRKLEKEAKSEKIKVKAKLAWAACQFNLRDFDAARKAYGEIIAKAADFPEEAEEARFQNAWLLYRQRDYEKSIPAFDEYINSYPEGKRRVESQYFRAWSLFRLNQFAEAETGFIAVADNPNADISFRQKARLDLGKTRMGRKKYPEAIAALETLATDFPESNLLDEAFYNLAVCHLKLDFPARAEEVASRLSAHNSASSYLPEIQRDLGDYYRGKGEFDKAEALYLEIIERKSGDSAWEARFSRATLYAESKKTDKAVAILKEVLRAKEPEAAPFQVRALLEILQIYADQGDAESGLKEITENRKFIAKDSYLRKETALREAKFLLMQKKWQAARKPLSGIIDDPDFSVPARFYLGESYYFDKMYSQAFDYFRQVSRKEDSVLAGQAMFYLGEIHLERKEYDKAAKEFTRVVYLYSGDRVLYEKALYKTSLSFQKTGAVREFESYRKKLAEAYPASKYLIELTEQEP